MATKEDCSFYPLNDRNCLRRRYANYCGIVKNLNFTVLKGAQIIKENTVAVLGGGLTGLGAAERLTEQGKTAIIVEILDSVGKDLKMYIMLYILGYLAQHQIKTYTNTCCIGLEKDGIIAKQDGKEIKIPCDALVMAAGSVSNNVIVDMVKQITYSYKIICDNEKPGKVIRALWAGNEIGRII